MVVTAQCAKSGSRKKSLGGIGRAGGKVGISCELVVIDKSSGDSHEMFCNGVFICVRNVFCVYSRVVCRRCYGGRGGGGERIQKRGNISFLFWKFTVASANCCLAAAHICDHDAVPSEVPVSETTLHR